MSRRKKILLTLLVILVIGFLIPQRFKMPVEGADKGSYNQKSFWYYPWGKSGTHKGVDIFSKTGTPVHSSTPGFVAYKGKLSLGGNVVCVLGPKWRLHYYAHLDQIKTSAFAYVNHSSVIGTIGTSGNAKGKTPHLHYSIITLIPYIWRVDTDHQGWKKMWYLDPIGYLRE
jgi:murein DD-endopeptidase MepM/ murein hydrolase activator NlpD